VRSKFNSRTHDGFTKPTNWLSVNQILAHFPDDSWDVPGLVMNPSRCRLKQGCNQPFQVMEIHWRLVGRLPGWQRS
jgi:hypothetical protein